MSFVGSALRAVAVVAVIGGTFYAGKTHGRYCEAKDGRMSIAMGNQDALLRMDDLNTRLGLAAKDLTDDAKVAIDALTESMYRRITSNTSARVIWEDMKDDIEQIKKLAGLD